MAQVRCPLPAVETADEGYWLEREMYVAVTHNGKLCYSWNLHNELPRARCTSPLHTTVNYDIRGTYIMKQRLVKLT